MRTETYIRLAEEIVPVKILEVPLVPPIGTVLTIDGRKYAVTEAPEVDILSAERGYGYDCEERLSIVLVVEEAGD